MATCSSLLLRNIRVSDGTGISLPMTSTQLKIPLANTALEHFRAKFSGDDPRVFFAPGRVNLVGAHLDYNGGEVLPVAVDRGLYVAARLRKDNVIKLHSLNMDFSLSCTTADVGEEMNPEHQWASYPLGVWKELQDKTGSAQGFEMVFACDLPIASGLSSSAAMEMATITALSTLNSLELTPVEKALISHRAENRYVKLQCGIMDQFASALGKRGQAILLNCSKQTFEYVPLASDQVEVLVMDTMMPRRLSSGAFNDRVRECQTAYQVLRGVRELPCLAAYTIHDMEAAGDLLSGTIRDRAFHVITEKARVDQAVAGLRRGDISTLGRSLNESHASARDSYEVSSRELNVITDAARELDSVYGARLTGAGFGGCAIALIRPGTAEKVKAHVQSRYLAECGKSPEFHSLLAGDGPGEILV